MARFFATSTALALALASSVHAAGPTDGINVTVTNTPLPVTGTLSGSVTGSVSVNNSATSPVPVRNVDNAAQQPNQFTLCFFAGFGISVTCNSVPNHVTLAPDRRMVIEHVAGGCGLSGSGVTGVQVVVSTVAGGVLGSHRFHLQLDPLDKRFLDVSQLTRLYADAGSQIFLSGSASAGPDPAGVDCQLTISGYTVTQ